MGMRHRHERRRSRIVSFVSLELCIQILSGPSLQTNEEDL
jgi:hypothetical protein